MEMTRLVANNRSSSHHPGSMQHMGFKSLSVTYPTSSAVRKKNRIHKAGSGRVFSDPGLDQNTVRDRENDKYLDVIRDLTAPQEAGLAKIWAFDAGISLGKKNGIYNNNNNNLYSANSAN